MNASGWYASLIKPDWAPPTWLFSPVWTVLYLIIAVSFGYVIYLYAQKVIPFWVLLPFLLNLLFNALFSPIQFGLQNNLLASIDIVLVWGTLVWAFAAIYAYAPWVVYANIPYFLWVSFASILQFSITYLNW